MMSERHIAVISGFLQEDGRPTTGLNGVTESLHDCLAGPGTWFYERQWNDDFKAVAALINRRSKGCPEVYIVGYSWGFGNGAIQLAKELQQFDIRVNWMFAIDPVYRSFLRFPALIPRNSIWSPSIKIPANVDKVTYWRQTNSIPQGHRLIPRDEKSTEIFPYEDDSVTDGVMRSHTHVTIDNSAEIRGWIHKYMGCV